MGVIKKQSIQSTILVYIGVFIGFFNAAILMPNLLSAEQKGLLDFLNSLSSIFAAICTLGLPFVTLKLFPKFRDNTSGHNSFFTIVVIVSIVGFLLGLGIFLATKELLISPKNSARGFPYFSL